MLLPTETALRLGSAIAIGLLIGAERERRKAHGTLLSAAGIRTFALAALSGGLSVLLGGVPLLLVVTVAIAALTTVAYLRTGDDDPGLTTETALLLTVLLGALAQRDVWTASGIAVVVTIILAARTALHRVVSSVLSDEEVTDALIFAAAVLVILPLTPDRYIGPFGAINPRTIWKIVILMMSISAFGYIAVRWLGLRFGLPITGLASGFVSSTATIASMGERAAREPALCRAAVAGAVLSTVATVLQMAVVVGATNERTLFELRIPLIAAGTAAVVYGLALTLGSLRQKATPSQQKGRAFSLKTALFFAAIITIVLVASAALRAWIGPAGVLVAAAAAGFADTHSPAVSVASLVAANKLQSRDAIVPILAAMTTNTVSKAIFAITSGGRRYAMQIIPGLVLVIAAAWGGGVYVLSR